MYDFLCSLSCIALEYVIWLIIIHSLLNLTYKKAPIRILITLPFVLLTAYSSTTLNNGSINFIVVHVLLFLWIFVVYRISITHTLFLFLSAYIIICIAELCVMPILGLSGNTLVDFTNQLLGLSLSTVCAILIAHFAPLHKFYLFIVKRGTTLKIIISNSFLLCCGIVIYAKVSPKGFMMEFLFLGLISLITIFINIDLFKNHQKIAEQKKQLQAYKDYLPVVENLIQHVRYKQHDYNNAITAIKMMPLVTKITTHSVRTLINIQTTFWWTTKPILY